MAKNSDLEAAVRTKAQDLVTFSARLSMHETFASIFNELYPLLPQLPPEGRELAEDSKKQFEGLLQKYEQLGRPNYGTDKESKEHLAYRQQFAKQLCNHVLNLWPHELELK